MAQQDIIDELNYLKETKQQIKQAIIDKGQDVETDTPFRAYADKILDISGGDTSDATAREDDVLAPETFYAGNRKRVGTISPLYEHSNIPIIDDKFFSNTVTNSLIHLNLAQKIAIYQINNYTIRIYEITETNTAYRLNTSKYKDVTTTMLNNNTSNSSYIYKAASMDIKVDENHLWFVFFWYPSASNVRGSAWLLNLDTFQFEGNIYTINNNAYNDYSYTFAQNIAVRPNAVLPSFVLAFNRNTSGRQHNMYGYELTESGTFINTISYSTTWYSAPDTNFLRYTPDGQYLYYTDASKTQKLYEYRNEALVNIYDTYSDQLIPLNNNIGIRGTNVYNMSTKEQIGTSDVSITRSSTNYLVFNDFLLVTSGNNTNIYSISNDVTFLRTFYNYNMKDLKYSHIGIFLYNNSTAAYYFTDGTSTHDELVGFTRKGISYYVIEDTTAISSDILEGRTAISTNGKIVGRMANQTSKSFIPTTSQQVIPEGYYNNNIISAVTSDIDINIIPEYIRNGVSILGVTGTFEGYTGGDATSDGTLQAKYLLEGYSAVVDGKWINGTMKNYGTRTFTPTSDDIEIPEGHYDSISIPQLNAANCEDYDLCSQAIASI